MTGLLAFLIATSISTAGAGDAVPPEFSESIESIRSEADLPALAVAAWRGEELVFLEATGTRAFGSEVPVTTDDRWHVGSCGKAMSATVLERLVAEGVLTWSTTIGEVFDDVDGIDDGWREVTLRQLITHRSGLSNDRKPVPAVALKIRGLKGTLPEQRRAFVEIVLDDPPAFTPGSRMAYSNYGYAVASAMAERRAGISWENLCRTRLFEPLGMTSPGFGAPGSTEVVDQPRGHLGETPLAPTSSADNPLVIAAAGTMHLSLKDWGRFLAVHLGLRPGFLSESRVETLHDPGEVGTYAGGWVVTSRPWGGGEVLTHSGSNNRWFAVVWIAPIRGWAFCAATNSASEKAAGACDQAIGLMVRAFQAKQAEIEPGS